MIIGTGYDLCNIDRIERVLDRYGDRFRHRIFTESEIAKAERRFRPADTYAKRFAAKEACAKALGTGVPRRGVHWKYIQVTNFPSGKPTIDLSSGALERIKTITPEGMHSVIHLTLTDDHPWAAASIIIEALPLQL